MKFDGLSKFLTADWKWFEQFGDVITDSDGEKHIFAPGKGINKNVLLCAHLDTVGMAVPVFKGRTVQAISNDCRLGAYVCCKLAREFGCSLLLTDNEECGRSTGASFVPDKQYNWVMSFDRKGEGDEAVNYQYGDEYWDAVIETFGWKVKSGAFSDISSLEHLGCKAVNASMGAEGFHTLKCTANLDHTQRSVNNFERMLAEVAHIHFEHEKVVAQPRWADYANDFETYSDNYANRCWDCTVPVSSTDNYCYECGARL
jgi:hypothetical protein